MTAWWALALGIGYVLAAFGLRTLLHRRRSGDTGFRGLSGRVFSAEWWAGVLFVAAVIAAVLGPVVALAGLPAFGVLDRTAVRALGIAVFLVGFAGTLIAQADMGSSWRIGVEDTEHTDLVTGGLFRWVRNPIFTAMVLAVLGLFLWVPNVVSLAAAILLVAAAQLQVRAVEEPYLRREHGGAYRAYAAAVGRFIPWVGRERVRSKTARDPAGSAPA